MKLHLKILEMSMLMKTRKKNWRKLPGNAFHALIKFIILILSPRRVWSRLETKYHLEPSTQLLHDIKKEDKAGIVSKFSWLPKN